MIKSKMAKNNIVWILGMVIGLVIMSSISLGAVDDAVDYYAFDNLSTNMDVFGVIGADGILDGAYDFDGIDDYVITNIKNLTSQMTFSMWVKTTDGTQGALFGSDGSTKVFLLGNTGATDGLFSFNIDFGGAQGMVARATDTDWNDGTWHHVVVQCNASDSGTAFWVDGTLLTTSYLAQNPYTPQLQTNAMDLMAIYDGGSHGNELDGAMDDFRMYDTYLTPTEISTLYNSGSGSSDMIGSEIHSNNLDGLSNYSQGSYLRGFQEITQTTSGKLSSGFDFDGTNDYLVGDKQYDWADEQSFSINLWFEHSDAISSTRYIFDDRQGGSSRGTFCTFYNSNNINCGVKDGSDNSISEVYTTQSFNDGSYHMLTMVYHGDNETMQIFLNGTLQIMNNANSAMVAFDTGEMHIGSKFGGSADFMKGAIDEFAVYDKALSTSEMAELYNSGDGYNPYAGSTPTPPTDDTINFTLEYPKDSSTVYTNLMEINVSGNYSYNTNISLYINGSLIGTENNVVGNQQITTFYHNFSLEDQVFTTYASAINNESTGNTSTHTVTIDLAEIRGYNWWTGASISDFNATIGGTTYSSVGGVIYSNLEGIYNATIVSSGRVPIISVVNLTNNNLNNVYLYQSVIDVWASEINTGNLLQNWTLTTNNGTYSTTGYNVTFYPDYGNYTWNFSNTQDYFNSTNISFTVSSIWHNFTILNLYARDIAFQDNISSDNVTPTCVQDGYSYSAYPYQMHQSNSSIVCDAFGYETLTFSNSVFPDSTTYNMTPVGLSIIFTENTEGIVQDDDVTIFTFTNISAINLQQINLSEGYVTVTFNNDSVKFQQVFKYYNDLDTTIKEDILIQDIDLQQEIRVTGQSQALPNSRVCAYYPYNDVYYTTYCDFTGDTGDVLIGVNDQNTYRFCVQADGFTPKCELYYIPASNQELITIDLVALSGQEGYNIVSTDCSPTYRNNETCGLDVQTYKPYYSICLNYTVTNASGNYTTELCEYDTASEVFSYALNTNNQKYVMEVYISGELEQRIVHGSFNSAINVTAPVNYRGGNNTATGQDIMEAIQDNLVLLIVVHMLLIGIGVFVGFLFEKMIKEHGIYASGLWFILLGASGFYILLIPGTVIIVHFFLEKLIPLLKN